jgi:3-hydroxy-9,10-secoandrosta-1,3,5(10)-triene-9,17-dione monooxygenase reductase component
VGFDDGLRRIGSDPFIPPVSEQDPARRLRGRLTTPVTVWTAYDRVGAPAAITVSSVLVAEGEPPDVIGLLGPLSEFWDAVRHSKRFLVHVLPADQTGAADRFARRYPGDPFEGLSTSPTPWGPLLEAAPTRAACSLSGYLEVGYSLMVRGRIDDLVVADDNVPPLVHYRGRYLTVGPRR